jgi:hypothetical protein
MASQFQERRGPMDLELVLEVVDSVELVPT